MEIELLQNYQSTIDKLSFVEQGLVSGVLFCCVVSVVTIHSHPQQETANEAEEDGNTQQHQQPAATNEIFNEQGEFVQLSRVSSSASFKGLFKVAENAATLFDDYTTSPIIVDYDDSMRKDRLRRHFEAMQYQQSSQTAPETNPDNISSALLEFEIMATIRSQIMRLITGKDGLPLLSGMSAVERGIQESELLTFTSLTASDLYRANQLQIFSEMVSSETRPLPNFTGLRILDSDHASSSTVGGDEEQALTKRKFFRQTSALLLAQTLRREIMTNPLVLRQYYPLTDELLLALHWPPLPRRHGHVLWKNHVAASQQIGQETLTIMPAGQMIVRVEQSVPEHDTHHEAENEEDTSKADLEQWQQQPWLTAVLDNNIMSVRLLPQSALGGASSQSQALLSHASEGHVAHSLSHHEGSDESHTAAADDTHTTTSKDTVQVPPSPCMFTLDPADSSGRYMFFDGPSIQPQRKPDGHGTVCFSAMYEQRGMAVTLCSNGDLKIVNTHPVAQTNEYPLHNEKSRFISANGIILRHFCLASEAGEDIFTANKHPYRMEAMHSDGTRELFVDKQALALFLDDKHEQSLTDEQLSKECFELKLLRQVPLDAALIVLTPSGDVLCSSQDTVSGGYVPLDWQYQSRQQEGTSAEVVVDAETRTIVRRYLDNRVMIVTAANHPCNAVTMSNDDQQQQESSHRVLFPDGTSILHSHRSGLLYLTREDKHQPSYPEVEIDLDIDAMCRGHAAGREVPINKGGERVRLRLALPCGVVAFVKYDTRVTASSNGSLHVVTQDRFDMLCRDDGELTVTPPTAWSAVMQEALDHDSRSTEEELNPVNKAPPPPVMTASRASILNGGDSLVSSLAGVESAINGKKSSRTNNNISSHTPSQQHAAATVTAPLIRPRNSSRITAGITVTPGTAPGRPASPNSPANKRGIESGTSAGVEPDATLTIYLGRGVASLFDCEFNRFTVDLSAGRRALYLHAHGSTTTSKPKRGRSADKAQKNKKGSSESRPITPSTADPARAYSLTVDLAGEVIGLKPPAVAKSPKPPRLFLVSRQGDAVEVLPTQMIARWQQMVMRKLRPGMLNYLEEGEKGVILSPAELGPARQWRYFLPARIGHAAGSDQERSLSLFEGVIGMRAYLKAMRGEVMNDGQKMVLLPAAARHVLRLMSKSSNIPSNHIRVFEALSVVERPPLSNEGYTKVTAAIAKCEEFRNNRLKSIDRFAVADIRTPEMIEEEEAMTKRLKAAYKLAKITAAKRKESKRQDAIEEGDEDEDAPASKQPSVMGSARSASGQLLMPSSARSLQQQLLGGNKGPPVAGQHHAAHHSHHGGHHGHGHGLSPIKAKEATILEASDEEEGSDGDDDNDGDDDDSEAGEKEVDPLQAALKSAFEDFADDQDLLPVKMLQEVFIRLLGRYIDDETIEQAAIDSGEVDPGIDEVTWSEFRAVYTSLDRLLNGGGPNQLLGDDEEVIGAGTDDGDERGTDPGVEEEYYHMGLPSRGVDSTSSPPRYGRSAQSTAPMLNLQSLRQPADNVFGSAANSPLPSAADINRAGQGLAAGSALQFVRNVKSAGGH